jgi:uncharacterized protein
MNDFPAVPEMAQPMGYPGATWAFYQARNSGDELRTPGWGMGDVLVSLLGTLILAALVRLGLSKNHIDPEHGWGLIIAFTTPWICLAGWPCVAAVRKGNGFVIDFGLLRYRPHLRLGVLAGLASLALASVAAFFTQLAFGPISSSAGDAGKQQHGAVLVTFALLALIGAPIVEEIAFRGMLFGALVKSQFTPLVASLMSAGVFALFHFEPKRFLVLFVVGAVLGEARRRSGSTLASIVAHMVNNAPAVVSLLGVQIAFFGH